MTGFPLIIAFIIAVILMIVAISKFKIHPFLSIMGVSLILGLVAGIPLVDVKDANGAVTSQGLANVIGAGFSGTFTSIGIVIILGALIGSILEATGAAFKLADLVIKLVGKKRPELAILLMGWVVSIPVFCDSGFVILNPIRKALVKRTMTSSVAMTVALSAGLYISHVFIPPTPGPIAAANTLGIGNNLLLVMGMGALCSIAPLIAGYFFAKYIGKKVKAGDDIDNGEVVKTYEQLVAEYGKLPGGLNALAPIIVPILLMALGSISSMAGWSGMTAAVCGFLGTPIIALAVGTIFGVIQLSVAGRMDKFYEITNETLKTVGPILFVTAAGGVLGKVISSSDMVNYITANAAALETIGAGFLHSGHHHDSRYSCPADGRAWLHNTGQRRFGGYGDRRGRDDRFPRERFVLLGCYKLRRDDAGSGLQDADDGHADPWNRGHGGDLYPVPGFLR